MVISVASTLVAVEVCLALFWPQIFEPTSGMYLDHEEIGYVLTPGFEGELQRNEFHVSISINETGMRGPNLRPKTSSTFRILCLGDSFTWGWGANDDENYPYVLESLLNRARPIQDIQVLNAGVPGYGTVEELAYLRAYGPRLRPDLVIAQFFAGNDFEDNRRVLNKSAEGNAATQDEPERWGFWDGLERVKQRSHLVNLVSNRLGELFIRAGWMSALTHPSWDYFTDEDAALATQLLVEISRTARELGATVVFMFVPEGHQLFALEGGEPRAADVVRAAAQSVGQPWVNLTPELSESIDDYYFRRDGHWTPVGHRRVAEIMTERLSASGVFDASSDNDGNR